MNDALSIRIPLPHDSVGVEVSLDARGALYWPDAGALFIADPHFGKAATFHRAGIAIPSKLLEYDLDRLDSIIHRHGAQRLIILGDFYHTKESQSDGVFSRLVAWRDRHNSLDVSLIPGNHDQHAGAPPTALSIEELSPETVLGPFCLAHEPYGPPGAAPSGHGYRLAGHLHPSVTLHGPAGTRMSERCFVIGPNQAILPAFGSFTGRVRYLPTARERIFVIGNDQIIEITRRVSRRSAQRSPGRG